MIDLLSTGLNELRDLMCRLGEGAFRANQIFDWVYRKKITDFDSMTNLSKALRAKLREELYFPLMEVVNKQVSSDGTEKFLWRLHDGEYIESVLLRHPEHFTFCISSQVGCALGCSFCATGAGGFTRNLSAGEIVGQVLLMEKDLGSEVDNIVFMGMGEPFLNEENLYASIDILHEPAGRNLGIRHFTISTAGLPEGIMRLADSGRDLRLSVSLHSCDDRIRSLLMPVNRRFPLSTLRASLDYYQRKTGNRLTFEYALVKGMNDSKEDVERLVKYLEGLKAFVNVIPVNPVDREHERPDEKTIDEFVKAIKSKGIEAALRYERGIDIAAACGQLRRQKGGRAWKEEGE